MSGIETLERYINMLNNFSISLESWHFIIITMIATILFALYEGAVQSGIWDEIKDKFSRRR